MRHSFVTISTVMCLDAKMRFDDNAEFRQKKVFSFHDWSQENPNEVEAAQYGLNYITLDGNLFNPETFKIGPLPDWWLPQVISVVW